MALIVECRPLGPNGGLFCLSGPMWEKALLVGLLNGWIPEGAQKAPGVDGEKWALTDMPCGYRCEEFLYGKVMTDSDALGLAGGLEAYLKREFTWYGGRENALKQQKPQGSGILLLKEGMDDDLLIDANRSWSIEFVETIITFLKGGGFVFYWDD